MKFFQAAIIAALAVPTAAINEPVVSPTVTINDNEPIVSPTAAIEHGADAQIDHDRELQNESQNTVALLNAEDPPVRVQHLMQMAESQVSPMFKPCQVLSKEVSARAFETEANQDDPVHTLARGFGVNYVYNQENMEDPKTMQLVAKQARPIQPMPMGMPCQVLSKEATTAFEAGPGPAELVIFDRTDKQVNEVEFFVVKEVIDLVENPSVEDLVVLNEDVIEKNEGSQQQDEAPILQRQRESETATTMTSNAKTSKSPSPASTKTSKEPKAATMAVEEASAEEDESFEAGKVLAALEKDYEEVGVETAENEEEDEEEDGN